MTLEQIQYLTVTVIVLVGIAAFVTIFILPEKDHHE